MKKIFIATLFLVTTAQATPTPNPTEGQIAQILLTANDLEIKAAQIAANKAADKDIRQRAKDIVKDHTQNIAAIKKLMAKNKLKAEDSITQNILQEDFITYDEDLHQKTGRRFDLTYIYHEVSFHEAMIASIDDTLAPNAKTEALSNLLTDYRAMQKKHLTTAKVSQTAIDQAPNRDALP